MIELKDGIYANIRYLILSSDGKKDKKVISSLVKQGLISKRMKSKAERITVAEIYPSIQARIDGEVPIAVGVAGCSKKDNFNKKVGRNMAIGRAISKIFNKEDVRETA